MTNIFNHPETASCSQFLVTAWDNRLCFRVLQGRIAAPAATIFLEHRGAIYVSILLGDGDSRAHLRVTFATTFARVASTAVGRPQPAQAIPKILRTRDSVARGICICTSCRTVPDLGQVWLLNGLQSMHVGAEVLIGHLNHPG